MINPMKGLIETFILPSLTKGCGNNGFLLIIDDIIFCDPAFGELKGDDAKAMWKCCRNAADLRIEFSEVTHIFKKGTVHSGSMKILMQNVGRKFIMLLMQNLILERFKN